MKRLTFLVVAAVAGAAAAAGGWYYHSRTGADHGERLLAHVPSDTILFVGNTSAQPWRELFESWSHLVPTPSSDLIMPLSPREAAEEGGPALGLYFGLLEQYQAALEDGSYPLDVLGVAEDGVSGLYAVGAVPVMRWQLADGSTPWSGVNAAERSAGISAEQETRGGMELRRYPLDTGQGGERRLEVVIAAGDGFGIVTLDGTGIAPASLDTALGLKKPGSALEQARLDRLEQRHGLLQGTAGFIDHRELMAGLSGEADSGFGRALDEIASAWGAPTPLFPTLRTAECRADALAIAERWPRTVIGLSELDAASGRIGQRLVVESTDTDTLKELMRLRGHVPEAVGNAAVFGLGLGIDISALVPVVENLRGRLADTDFGCPPLVAAQGGLQQGGIAQLGMVTAMLTDIKGVAAILLDLRPSPVSGQPPEGDGVLTVATANPEALWSRLQSMTGLTMERSPEIGGEPVPLPPQLSFGMRARVSLQPNSISLLVGDTEPAARPEPESLAPNGLLAMSYHYGRFFSALAPTLRDMPADDVPPEQRAATEEMFRALQDMNVNLRSTVDVDDSGIGIDMILAPES